MSEFLVVLCLLFVIPRHCSDGEPDLAAAAVAVVAAAAAEVMDLPPAPIPPTPPPVVDSPIVLLNSEEEFLPTDADALMMQSLVDM